MHTTHTQGTDGKLLITVVADSGPHDSGAAAYTHILEEYFDGPDSYIVDVCTYRITDEFYHQGYVVVRDRKPADYFYFPEVNGSRRVHSIQMVDMEEGGYLMVWEQGGKHYTAREDEHGIGLHTPYKQDGVWLYRALRPYRQMI